MIKKWKNLPQELKDKIIFYSHRLMNKTMKNELRFFKSTRFYERSVNEHLYFYGEVSNETKLRIKLLSLMVYDINI